MTALMLVAAAGLGVSIVLYRHRRPPRARSHAREGSAGRSRRLDRQRGGFALVIKDRYLRVLAVMLLVATIINTTGEYVIGKMATDRARSTRRSKPRTPSRDPDARGAMHDAENDYISSFYSSYYTLVNVLSALLQALVVAWLLRELGIRRALFIMPLIVLGGWFALLVFANLTMVRIEKTAENSLDYSLHNTLRQALFLPTVARGQVQGEGRDRHVLLPHGRRDRRARHRVPARRACSASACARSRS